MPMIGLIFALTNHYNEADVVVVKVYCIAQIRACDKEQLSESAGTAGPTVAQYGGLSA